VLKASSKSTQADPKSAEREGVAFDYIKFTCLVLLNIKSLDFVCGLKEGVFEKIQFPMG